MANRSYMENKLGGLNEPALEQTVLKLNNDIDEIDKIISNIELKVFNMKSYFTGELADSFYDKFETLDAQTKNLKDNLNSYSNDLLAIRNTYKNTDRKAAQKIDEYSQEINDKTSQVTAEEEAKEASIQASIGSSGAIAGNNAINDLSETGAIVGASLANGISNNSSDSVAEKDSL